MISIESRSNNQRGNLEVIYGSMFAGKTEELMRLIRTYSIKYRRSSRVFKSDKDSRYNGVSQVTSHYGNGFPCTPIKSGPEGILEFKQDVLSTSGGLPRHIAIDEIQFLDPSLLPTMEELLQLGINISCAGLYADFRNLPWGFMPQALAMADRATQVFAICMEGTCEELATRTQRLVREPSGIVRPAYIDEPLISVGAQDTGAESDFYEARCGQHFQLLNRQGEIVKGVFSSMVS